jgi:hypothetical protein
MNLDLNPSNYTLQEMNDLFKLDSAKGYTVQDVINKATTLAKNIQLDISISDSEKQSILTFLKTIKDRLLDNIGLKTTTSLMYEDSHQKVIEESKSLFMPAYPSNIYAGVINPLKRRTIQKNVNIDTRFRNQHDVTVSTNFRIELPFVLNNVLSMHLRTFEFPSFSFNICSDLGNNFFSINSQLIFLPDGFYTLPLLVETINATLETKGIEDIKFHILPNQKLQIHSETLTNMIDFETSKDINSPLVLKLGWVLGFRQKNYQDSKTYVSEAMADLITLKYCFLCINDYNNNTVNNAFISALSESILNNNILARISQPTQIITTDVSNFNFVCPTREYFGPVTITAMHIQLLDPYGRILNLHNLDYSFCLSFDILYDL